MFEPPDTGESTRAIDSAPTSPVKHRLVELAALFLRLDFTAFGGPAAHIGMMHDETVKPRKWLTDQQFLDLLGVTNLIPGPHGCSHLATWPGVV